MIFAPTNKTVRISKASGEAPKTNILRFPYTRRLRSHLLKKKTIKEVKLGLVEHETLRRRLETGLNVLLRGKLWTMGVGEGLLAKINVPIGANHPDKYLTEVRKIEKLSSLAWGPDIIQDLSLARFEVPLYRRAIDMFGGPVGTLPTYLSFDPAKGTIEPSLLLETIEEQAECGVAFMSLHAAVNREIYGLAKRTRAVPITSRGGGIVVRDMLAKKEDEGIVSRYFSEILKILKKHNVALSLGCSFRSASVREWLDSVQQKELLLQEKYILAARKAGVKVMLEAGGSHAPLDKLVEFGELIKPYEIPVMPLGPVTTDSAIGADHIAAAIGASHLASLGAGHVFTIISPQEHTGEVPTLESILEGVKAMLVAAHSVNISNFPRYRQMTDDVISGKREKTCIVDGGLFEHVSKDKAQEGCTRCDSCCPLIVLDA